MRISLRGVGVQEKVSSGDGRNDAFQNTDESFQISKDRTRRCYPYAGSYEEVKARPGQLSVGGRG